MNAKKFIPHQRLRLNEELARGADNQSFLVESVSSAETEKSLPSICCRRDTATDTVISPF
jgi:hypothetical protein